MKARALFRKICADYGTYQCQDHVAEKCPARGPCLDMLSADIFRDEKMRSFNTMAGCPLCGRYAEAIITRDFIICQRCYDRFTEIISELTNVDEQLLKEMLQ